MWLRIKCGACIWVLRNSATPTTVSVTSRQLTGLAAGVVARTVATDIHGNETVSTTAIDRANKTLVQTTDLPDSSVDEQSVTVNGLLVSKTYAPALSGVEGDAKAVSYTYSSDGKLATRTWARSVGTSPLVTNYSYSTSTGELTSIDYSDSTPDVAFTYNRLGQQKTVTDVVGTAAYKPPGVIKAAYKPPGVIK